jgi:hypothetical protein
MIFLRSVLKSLIQSSGSFAEALAASSFLFAKRKAVGAQSDLYK